MATTHSMMTLLKQTFNYFNLLQYSSPPLLPFQNSHRALAARKPCARFRKFSVKWANLIIILSWVMIIELEILQSFPRGTSFQPLSLTPNHLKVSLTILRNQKAFSFAKKFGQINWHKRRKWPAGGKGLRKAF